MEAWDGVGLDMGRGTQEGLCVLTMYHIFIAYREIVGKWIIITQL